MERLDERERTILNVAVRSLDGATADTQGDRPPVGRDPGMGPQDRAPRSLQARRRLGRPFSKGVPRIPPPPPGTVGFARCPLHSPRQSHRSQTRLTAKSGRARIPSRAAGRLHFPSPRRNRHCGTPQIRSSPVLLRDRDVVDGPEEPLAPSVAEVLQSSESPRAIHQIGALERCPGKRVSDDAIAPLFSPNRRNRLVGLSGRVRFGCFRGRKRCLVGPATLRRGWLFRTGSSTALRSRLPGNRSAGPPASRPLPARLPLLPGDNLVVYGKVPSGCSCGVSPMYRRRSAGGVAFVSPSASRPRGVGFGASAGSQLGMGPHGEYGPIRAALLAAQPVDHIRCDTSNNRFIAQNRPHGRPWNAARIVPSDTPCCGRACLGDHGRSGAASALG